MTVLRLTELLERGERLPRPDKCPCEVRPSPPPLRPLPFHPAPPGQPPCPLLLSHPQVYLLMKNCWETEASFRPTFQNLSPLLKTAHDKYQGQSASVFSVC